jgi:phage-related holin
MRFISEITEAAVTGLKSTQYTEKFTTVLFLGIFNMPILEVFEKYIFSDWETLFYVLALLCVDLVLGFVKHIKEKTWSLESAFAKMTEKVILSGCLLVVTHVLYSHQAVGGLEDSAETIRYFGHSIAIGYLMTTIAKNFRAISGGRINIQKLIDLFKK